MTSEQALLYRIMIELIGNGGMPYAGWRKRKGVDGESIPCDRRAVLVMWVLIWRFVLVFHRAEERTAAERTDPRKSKISTPSPSLIDERSSRLDSRLLGRYFAGFGGAFPPDIIACKNVAASSSEFVRLARRCLQLPVGADILEQALCVCVQVFRVLLELLLVVEGVGGHRVVGCGGHCRV